MKNVGAYEFSKKLESNEQMRLEQISSWVSDHDSDSSQWPKGINTNRLQVEGIESKVLNREPSFKHIDLKFWARMHQLDGIDSQR